VCLLLGGNLSLSQNPPVPGISYTNIHVADIPWSIHVVQLDRANPAFQLLSIHARAKAIGLDTLTGQTAALKSPSNTVFAAINADYYQRDMAHQGAPRGLQVSGGELLSAPSGGAAFWIDATGQPHTQEIASKFEITFADGARSPFGLNGDRREDLPELYTPAAGASTGSKNGTELILERAGNGPWLPLRLGKTYQARIREVRQTGDSPIAPDAMVLSLSAAFARKNGEHHPGEILQISTASEPMLRGVRAAIGGGPVLLHNGEKIKSTAPDSESYKVTSMFERHPRSAIGWNDASYFLVEVDGRQRDLSVGMTLDELAKFLLKLGCREAMNFDGGGSATLWFDGQVRNSPCDQEEREIANCLAIVKTNKPESRN
jgi:exopolysaccharide biosynthesis protein